MNESRLRLRRPHAQPTESDDLRGTDQVVGPRPHGVTEQRASALAGALLALISAIVGGAITAGASVWVAGMTVEAQQKQSIAEYRRDNREKIYQDMLAQMTAMDSVMTSISLQMLQAGVLAQQPHMTQQQFDIFAAAEKQWQPAYDRLAAAVSNAELVSSRQVIRISKALRDAYFRQFYDLTHPGLLNKMAQVLKQLGTESPNIPPQPSPSEQPKLPEGSAQEYPPELAGRRPYELKTMFIQESKNDLQLND